MVLLMSCREKAQFEEKQKNTDEGKLAQLSSRKFIYNYSIEFFRRTLQTIGSCLVISIVVMYKIYSDPEQQRRESTRGGNCAVLLYCSKIGLVNFHRRSSPS